MNNEKENKSGQGNNLNGTGNNENGAESEDENENKDEVEDGGEALLDTPECVICLTDVRDTIVLPCRHFCVCSECGDILRSRPPQRCPICRQSKC